MSHEQRKTARFGLVYALAGAFLFVALSTFPLPDFRGATVRDAYAQSPATVDNDPSTGAQFGRAGVYDPNKILRITEEYPQQLQNVNQLAATFDSTTGAQLTTGLKKIGVGVTFAPYGWSSLVVQRSAIRQGATSVRIYLFGSDDDVTYYPVIGSDCIKTNAVSAAGDSSTCDTVHFVIPNTAAAARWKVTIDANKVYPGRYLALYAVRDSFAGSSCRLGWAMEGRWK